ncbi:pyruvate kinase [Gloeobacter morelensis]|uniref:Pyruvate kinase n=1 Tax=Gloeobacter morelensis MG652769 TaxID=2781736 RepID=A0ABY3PK89_9CYAN|nr:pyruvate kinase [Gloeobacter morelensis MG652769]
MRVGADVFVLDATAQQTTAAPSERARFRRTKIVATIGPAVDDPQALRRLIQAGATTLRLNFSHGTHEEHRRRIGLIRQISFELNQPVAILQDLQGPKIRLGKFADGPIVLKHGDPFILTSHDVPANQHISPITYSRLIQEVPSGATILLDDGRVELVVERVDLEAQYLHCRTVGGGKLSNSKGVNFPGVTLSVPAMTEKDREDLLFGLNQGVDWVALSFVRTPSDLLELKELIAQAGKRVPVIAKIEKFEAFENLDAVIAACDGLMVARGDLGVEMPAEEVPLLQKRLIASANRAGKPVITATQMLDSMVSNSRPTRAEVSDVANAILDGTDAVMLSNETAVGEHPILAVETMARIADRIERSMPQRTWVDTGRSIPNAISQAVGSVAQQLGAQAILTLTKSGATARNVSKYRPKVPIIAITPSVSVARELQMVWGVYPLMVLDLPSTRQTFQAAISAAQDENLVLEGDLVVMTAGTIQGLSGSTDLIKVEVVTAILGRGLGLGQNAVSGRARVVRHSDEAAALSPGDILIAPRTDANFIEAIKLAGGIVTEEGGLTSHAAIIGLRLGLPVLLGVKDCTTRIPDGVVLTLDPQKGVIFSGAASAV